MRKGILILILLLVKALQKFIVYLLPLHPGFHCVCQQFKGAEIFSLSLKGNLGHPAFLPFVVVYAVISAGIGLDQTPSFDCLQKRDGRPLRQLQVLFIDTGLKTAAAFRLSALPQRTGSANASTMKRGTYYETW